MGQFDPKFQVEGAVPTSHSMYPINYMNLPFVWYKNLGGTFVRFVTIHACDGQTDRQTDRRTDTFAASKKDRLHTAAR